MNAECHKLAGIISGATTGAVISHGQNVVITGGCIIAGAIIGGVSGLLPDIDKRNSTVGKKAKAVSYATEKLAGHRGLMHSPFLALVLTVGMIKLFELTKIQNIIIENIVWCFTAGYLSHIILDFLTPRGVPLLYPIFDKKVHILGLKGKEGEQVSIIFLVVICFFIIIYVYFGVNIFERIRSGVFSYIRKL